MRVPMISLLAAAALLGGCALAPAATPTPSAPGSAAPTAAPSSSGPAAPETPGVSASGTAVPSVAPGTVIDPKEFTAQLRGAMKSAASYEYDTVSSVETPDGTKSSTVHTVVDQVDLNNIKVRTEMTNGTTTVVMIMIGETQYTQQPDGKFRKDTVPAQSSAAYTTAGLDIENGAKSVTYVGPEQVDGADARHYTAEMLPPTGAGQSADPTGQTVTYDLWLDAQGRLVKAQTRTGQMDTTQTYSKYDQAAAVTAPDPSQVEG